MMIVIFSVVNVILFDFFFYLYFECIVVICEIGFRGWERSEGESAKWEFAERARRMRMVQ